MPDSGTPPRQLADDVDAAVRDAVLWLRTLDPAAVAHRPAPGRWTIQEVIGHLIDSAANNHQRFVRAQFVPELTFPAYQQNDWVAAQSYQTADWPDLLDLWHRCNRHLAHIIRHVRPAALSVRCTIGSYEPVTLQFLIEDYLTHLKHHLDKIREKAGMAAGDR